MYFAYSEIYCLYCTILWVLTDWYNHAATTTIKIESFIAPEFSPGQFCSQPFSHSHVCNHRSIFFFDLFSIPTILPLQECLLSEITQNVRFWLQLFSLKNSLNIKSYCCVHRVCSFLFCCWVVFHFTDILGVCVFLSWETFELFLDVGNLQIKLF